MGSRMKQSSEGKRVCKQNERCIVVEWRERLRMFVGQGGQMPHQQFIPLIIDRRRAIEGGAAKRGRVTIENLLISLRSSKKGHHEGATHT